MTTVDDSLLIVVQSSCQNAPAHRLKNKQTLDSRRNKHVRPTSGKRTSLMNLIWSLWVCWPELNSGERGLLQSAPDLQYISAQVLRKKENILIC